MSLEPQGMKWVLASMLLVGCGRESTWHNNRNLRLGSTHRRAGRCLCILCGGTRAAPAPRPIIVLCPNPLERQEESPPRHILIRESAIECPAEAAFFAATVPHLLDATRALQPATAPLHISGPSKDVRGTPIAASTLWRSIMPSGIGHCTRASRPQAALSKGVSWAAEGYPIAVRDSAVRDLAQCVSAISALSLEV